ncbi:Uma2 family endonuclease [Rubrobacter taiwanensis]|jgi:Uma2 family endonuclease|uniref:Uma2 family endonuclease n=1 Tax=Rubrobacter taiwanensis TaxID=185139 RepID=A0A4R1B936_9ACTN|nr:Uma2 family endonuclease [Rubrobacter taiwanensis]TCJ13069.1 Uma2 family endonuclease [Rubrobacter taiwanensis]
MAEKATPHRPLSVEEYLALEESASVRHEYVAGETYALAGATDRHNRISLNIASRLLAAARGTPCRVYMSDMKLRASESVFYYPDVMVVCGPPEPGNPDFQRDPCLVVEVLSPSTEQIDRREKLLVYENIPSVGAYLVVSQDIRRVERHFRGEDGLWRKADLVDVGRFPVPCPPDTELTLDEVYEGL